MKHYLDMEIEDMELGNLIFGHSRGQYHLDDRDRWQDMFWDYFAHDFDYHMFYIPERGDEAHTTDRGGYENDIFKTNPYYWGDDEDIMEEPNFIYKPTGLEIRWYKYPLRDTFFNQDISFEEGKRIFEHCAESIKSQR